MPEDSTLKGVLQRVLSCSAAELSARDFIPAVEAEADLPAGITATLSTAARSLIAGGLQRGAVAGRGGRFLLGAGEAIGDSSVLRCWLADDLPGLTSGEAEIFAHLADQGDPPVAAGVQGLLPPTMSQEPAPIGYDLFSGPAGSVCWFDIRVKDGATAADAIKPPGWCRAPVHVPGDLLRRVGGDAEIAVLTEDSFLDDTLRVLAKCEEALGSDDLHELHRLSHGLKGAALNIGAPMLAAVAHAAEREAEAGRTRRVAAILPRMIWEFDRLAQHLDRR